jgi:tetratricopeptide (TPR) repeat protein
LQVIQDCLSLIEADELSGHDNRFEKALAYRMLPWVINDAQHNEKIEIAKVAVQLFESLEEPWWVGSALLSLGLQLQSRSRIESIKVFEQSLAVCRKQQNLAGIALSLEILSNAKAQVCQFDEAEALAYEALAIYDELSNRYRMVVISMRLGSHLVWQGRFQEARLLYHETLETHRDIADTQSFASIIHSQAGFPDQYLGEYQAACNQAKRALQLLGEVKHLLASYGRILAISILGRIALIEDSYAEAEHYFQQCLAVFRNHHQDDIGQTRACLGYSARKLNQASQAQRHCYEALRLAVEKDSFLSLIHTLPCIALLFADQEDTERAVEIYALAATMGIVMNSKWFEDIAGTEIARLAEKLPPDLAAAARIRGQSMDLWATAVNLLEELDRLGWNSTDN